MKLNLFLFSYNGNKYNETKGNLKHIDVNKYDIICEPFCGIFGLSRALFEMHPEYKGEFWLNDIDSNLINDYEELKNSPNDLFKRMEDEVSIYKTNKEMTDDKNKSNTLARVYRGRNDALMELEKGDRKIVNYKKNLKYYEIFYNKVRFFNMDYIEFVNSLPEDKKILIFFDPPYITSNNKGYKEYDNNYMKDYNNNIYMDPSIIFVRIKEIFDKSKHDCLAIYNYLSLLDFVYGKYKKNIIQSKYGNGRIKFHVIYDNFS